jgi:hypothetical protein
MLEIARYGGRQRVKGSLAMAVGISLLAGLVIWLFPSFRASINIDEMLSAYPEPVLKAFGIETMASIEGFLAVELYSFVWVILLALYTAYAAAGMVADAVEHERMDLWLSLPVRRWRLLLEQFLTLLVPIVVVNVVVPVAVRADRRHLFGRNGLFDRESHSGVGGQDICQARVGVGGWGERPVAAVKRSRPNEVGRVGQFVADAFEHRFLASGVCNGDGHPVDAAGQFARLHSVVTTLVCWYGNPPKGRFG